MNNDSYYNDVSVGDCHKSSKKGGTWAGNYLGVY